MKWFWLIASIQAASDAFMNDECWNSAYRYIAASEDMQLSPIAMERKDACKNYSKEKKQIIALLMTECHYRERWGNPGCMNQALASHDGSDLNPPANVYEDNLNSCLSKLDSFEYSSFQNHYTHVEDSCYLLFSALWQSRTENLMTDLQHNSFEINRQLRVAYSNHMKLIEQQTFAIDSQKHILTLSNYISDTLQNSNTKLDDAFNTIQARLVMEHDVLKSMLEDVYAIVSSLHRVQTFFKSKYMSIERTFFYLVILYLSRVLTNNVRTAGIRYLLGLGIAIFYGIEGLLISAGPTGVIPPDAPWNARIFTVTGFTTMILRFGMVSWGVGYWFSCYYTYVDRYEKQVNELKADLRTVNRKLDQMIGMASSYKSNTILSSNHYHNEPDSPLIRCSHKRRSGNYENVTPSTR